MTRNIYLFFSGNVWDTINHQESNFTNTPYMDFRINLEYTSHGRMEQVVQSKRIFTFTGIITSIDTFTNCLTMSRYVPEGNMTACGTDYLNKEWHSKSYILVYSFFVYYTPLSTIIYSYYHIVSVSFFFLFLFLPLRNYKSKYKAISFTQLAIFYFLDGCCPRKSNERSGKENECCFFTVR